jgi:hypothetical protein
MKKRGFVRYTKKGEVVPGSLIITNGSYPEGGTYKEVPYDLCCEDTSCNLGGSPVSIAPYQIVIEGDGINFLYQTTSNTIFFSLYCFPGYSFYWEGEFSTPVLSSIEEVIDYLNTTFSQFGTFTAVPMDLSPDYYGVQLDTTTGILSFLFPGECAGFQTYVTNYNS